MIYYFQDALTFSKADPNNNASSMFYVESTGRIILVGPVQGNRTYVVSLQAFLFAFLNTFSPLFYICTCQPNLLYRNNGSLSNYYQCSL